MAIKYSDGDSVEARILSIVRQEKELGSDVRIAGEQWGDWPVHYHLTPVRANLVRHLDWSGLDVLELGAGMGAVSRFLAERSRSLTVVEGTENRFAVLRERLRDLKNWKGVVGNIQSVELPEKFDVVCVIGVLEYSQLYVSAENPFAALLEKAISFLKPGGVLLVAIENKLGLKYWSGAAEDHSSKMFDGICGYPAGPSPKTFSRGELLSLLREAGMAHVDEQFPFPDYKLPSTVITKPLIDADARLAGDLAASRQFTNYMLPRVNTFPDILATQNVAQSGLLPEFANSFLFLATTDGKSEVRRHLMGRQLKGERAWHYGGGDHTPVETVFHDDKGALRVKKHIRAQRSIPEPLVWASDNECEIFPGENLRFRLFRHAYFADWDRFVDEMHAFLAWSLEKWSKGPELDEQALDAILNNAIVSPQGDYRIFDLEWHWKGGVPRSFFVFRNVYSLTREPDLFTRSAPFKNFGELYELLCVRLGVSPNLESDVDLEIRIQSTVNYHADSEQLQSATLDLFRVAFRETALPRNPLDEANLRQALTDLANTREELVRVHREYLALTAVLASPSHKIAGKIERIPYVPKVINRSYSGLKRLLYLGRKSDAV